MATATVVPEQQGVASEQPMPGQPTGDSATPSDKSTQATPAGVQGVSQELIDALRNIKQNFKLSWSPKRRAAVQRTLKAFEYLKNNPYSVFQYDSFEYNPILAVLGGQKNADDLEMYAHNDNVYQMLALSFIAVGQNNQDKTRYMPVDPQDEDDLQIADKASTMMADIERRNDTGSKMNLELLNLWCGGSYFSYVRNIVDAQKCGTSKEPILSMQDVAVLPDRYVCSNCGNVVPSEHTNPFSQPRCDGCQSPLGQADYYPEERMQVPMQVDEKEVPNSMTAIDVFNLLYVDADPEAQELEETPLLDLACNMQQAAVRESYPQMYSQIAAGNFNSTTGDDALDQMARDQVTSPGGRISAPLQEHRGQYSRCWIQPWAFNDCQDQATADSLKAEFPKGCKLVMWGDTVLEVVPEALLERWTWCPTVKGLGLFPFGIGDVALNVQERINDTANNVHAYMDRVAFPNILADVDMINVQAMNQNPQTGQVIGVKRTKLGNGMRDGLSSALFQPTYHIDGNIYSYGQQLIQLAQLLTGVQPQIFGGGTTAGVETASGQEQMLNTAMGRLMLFFAQQRAEHARRSKNAVRCMAKSIIGQLRIVVPGDVEGEYRNEFILESDVQGDFEAYPETDPGFPSTYEQMRDRLQQILTNMQENPLAVELMNDPDNAAVVAKYLLPDGIRVPGAAARNKIKAVLQQLVEQAPIQVAGQAGPIAMPSIQPDKDFDDMGMIVTLAKSWAQENYKLQALKPKGFENVRQYFRLASQYQAQSQAANAINMNSAASKAVGQNGPPAAVDQGAQAVAA
jgi:hypothetical protein